jgi:AcrR family transcriptional regulator
VTATSASFAFPPLDRLPSGRHRLTREAVKESQRGRLLYAMAQVVTEKGYAAATVGDIVERASVSRTTFYEQFPDKESCFLAAFSDGAEFVLGQMRIAADALGDEHDWRAHVRSDLRTYFDILVSEPAFAWALHVEVLAAGLAALERRAQILEVFTRRTERIHEIARKQDRSLPKLPPEAFRVHTGGMDELVRECLRTHGPESLRELAPRAIDATLALLGDRHRSTQSSRATPSRRPR